MMTPQLHRPPQHYASLSADACPEKALAMGQFDFGTNQRALDYFHDVIAKSKGSGPYPDIDVVIVIHAYRNAPPLVQSLSEVGNVRGVIIKNSTGTRHPEVTQFLKQHGFPILDWDKQKVKKGGVELIAELEGILRPDKPFIIVDHGGYFAYPSARDLFDHFPPDRLLGVTEYTANGHYRYERLGVEDRPIISVGRSDIKIPADVAAAKLIVQAAFDHMMQANCYLYDESNTIGVIGYGRMGTTIAKSLANSGFRHLFVNERDPLASTRLEGLPYAEKPVLLENCNILFCATGNRALDPAHYALLKDGTVIFTATSPDDELELEKLIQHGVLTLQRHEGDIYEYRVNATGNRVYLPFNGESANIVYPSGVTDPAIYLPQALQLAATVKLAQHQHQYSPGVTDLERRYENMVAQTGREHFARQMSEALLPRPHQQPAHLKARELQPNAA